MNKKTLIYNIFLLISSGFLVKALGLFNKIFLTRILGQEGISLYILAYPTIMLFTNLSSFGLKESISKLVSDQLILDKPLKSIIIKSIKISIFIILALSIILLISSPVIAKSLGEESLKILFLTSIPLIVFVSLGGILKGYLSGIKRLDIIAKSQLYEQIIRIIFSLALGLYFIRFSILHAVFFTLISLSIGEGFSFFYLVYEISKITKFNKPYIKNDNDYKRILNISFPIFSSRIISSISLFLEPLIYSLALKKIGLSSKIINESFGIFNGYALSLLTLLTFVSMAIFQGIFPNLTDSIFKKDYQKSNEIINLTLGINFFFSSFLMIIIYFYSKELLIILFDNSSGYLMSKNISVLFVLYYLLITLNGILVISKNTFSLVKISIMSSIIRLLLIYILSINPDINIFGLGYALLISLIFNFILSYEEIKKNLNFKLDYKLFISLGMLYFLGFLTVGFLNSNLYLSIFLLGLLYLLFLLKSYHKYYAK